MSTASRWVRRFIGISAAVLGVFLATVWTAAKPTPGKEDPLITERPPAQEVAKEFVYPDASQLGDKLDAGTAYCAKFTTPDDGHKVGDWYRGVFAPPAKPKTIEGISWGSYEGRIIREDSDQPKRSGRAEGSGRPVIVLVCMKRTREFTVNVVVTRASEDLTHIVLTMLEEPKGVNPPSTREALGIE